MLVRCERFSKNVATYIITDVVLSEYLQSKCNNHVSVNNVKEITTGFINFVNSNFHIQNCQYINSTSVFDKNIIQSNVSSELDELMNKELQINEDNV